MSDPRILRREGVKVSLLPHLGGAIGVSSVGGRDILRPTPRDATDPLETAFREDGVDYVAAMIAHALCDTVGRVRPLLVVEPRPDRRKPALEYRHPGR